jgi:hypothetical protein
MIAWRTTSPVPGLPGDLNFESGVSDGGASTFVALNFDMAIRLYFYFLYLYGAQLVCSSLDTY